ncbi:peptidoglycan/LPS O-acetylase OafA/YrhL [Leifsonia shinshuensis]|nr:peptidoglycan/LPS O-acetylase OafA/YrhL [Leifsonia shinshuensis]
MIAVILYHFGVPGLSGGFLGVDVFFVISGYVISRSLTAAHRDEPGRMRTWLLAFYSRRLWRIAPALLAMLLVVGVLFALFEPRGYSSGTILWTGIGASVGVSNMVLLGSQQGDYFDATTAFNPFLHTWSLGVEEQFYLVFPLILWLVVARHSRRGRFRGQVLLGLLAALSLVAAIWMWRAAPEASFYLLPTRFWELAAGALAFQAVGWASRSFPGAGVRRAMAWVASAAIVAAMVGLGGHDSPFPAALLPVAATVILIWFAPATSGWSAPGRWLEARPMSWVGRVSYSLYLWHWPVIVIWVWLLGHPGPVGVACAIAVSVGFAALSYYVVERPILRGRMALRPLRRRELVVGLTAVTATLALIVAVGWRHDGFLRDSPISLSVTARAAWASADLGADTAPSQKETGGTARLIVVGDSHANAYRAMLTTAARRLDMPIEIASRSGCGYTLLTPVPSDGRCDPIRNAVDSARRGDVVLFLGLRSPRLADNGVLEPTYLPQTAANAKEREEALQQFTPIAARLTHAGIRVILNNPEPLFAHSPYMCDDWWFGANKACRLPATMARSEEVKLGLPATQNIGAVRGEVPEVMVWDVFDALCPHSHDRCGQYDDDGHPLFVDTDHVSGWGNAAALPSFQELLERAANRQHVGATDD